MTDLVYAPLVQETSANAPNASTAYNLAGSASTGHQTFAAALADTEACVVMAQEVSSGSPSGAWELARCVYADLATDTLTRTLIASSTGSLIDWSALSAPRLTMVDESRGMGRPIDVQTVGSAVSTVQLTGFKPDCCYRVVYNAMAFDTDNVTLHAQLLDSGGSAITASNYTSRGFYGFSSSGWLNVTGNDEFDLTNYGLGNAAGEDAAGIIDILYPREAQATRIFSLLHGAYTTGAQQYGGIPGTYGALTAAYGIQLYASSGNIDGGTFALMEWLGQ